MLLTRNIELENRLKQWSWYFAVAVIFIAVLVLAGWEFNIDFFKHPLPHSKVMNPTAAVTFILTAISFLFLTSFPLVKTKRYIGMLLAVIVLFIGATKFFSFIAGYDFPIDNILFSHKLHNDKIVPIAAFNFMLLGTTLLFINTSGSRKVILVNSIVFIILCNGLFSVLGYLYDVKVFYGWLTYLPMAIHAAVCFILLSLAIVFANPSEGIMKMYTGEHTGSITARRLIPAAILVPALLGYFRLIGYRRGFFYNRIRRSDFST